MTKYINEETLRKLMYEEAFEKDSDMQKWDSGCWIRYKLFENCLEEVPAADVVEASSVVEIVHCKECKFGKWNAVECAYWCQGHFRRPDWYCADAKSKNGGQDNV